MKGLRKVGPDNSNKQSPGTPPMTMGHSKTPSTCPQDTTQSQFGKAQTSGKNQHARSGTGSAVENFKTAPKCCR
jgi:hypothetical protein